MVVNCTYNMVVLFFIWCFVDKDCGAVIPIALATVRFCSIKVYSFRFKKVPVLIVSGLSSGILVDTDSDKTVDLAVRLSVEKDCFVVTNYGTFYWCWGF